MKESHPSGYPSRGHRLPVAPRRRLVPERLEHDLGVYEYFDQDLEQRVIELEGQGVEARSHEHLLEERLPVFSGIYKEHELLLVVPDGSQAIQSLLKAIARDPASYGEIFYDLGKIIGELEEKGFGLPEVLPSRSILQSFAFCLNEESIFGGNIYIIPPYRFDPFLHYEQVAGAIHAELASRNQFDDPSRAYLLGHLNEGWRTGKELTKEGEHGGSV